MKSGAFEICLVHTALLNFSAKLLQKVIYKWIYECKFQPVEQKEGAGSVIKLRRWKLVRREICIHIF